MNEEEAIIRGWDTQSVGYANLYSGHHTSCTHLYIMIYFHSIAITINWAVRSGIS
jgi:hypothetical protein